ncbi:MAG: hypothetical protein M1815_004164 [Lichina confinis]|nr:MAG: hypothetical protein M1815_004164 [Lichina confinis]
MSAFASHLQSGTIRLRVVGAAAEEASSSPSKEFVVHRSLLSDHLRGLRTSPHERCVYIEGDADTVGCLLEFIYTGDYNPSVKSVNQSPTNEGQPSSGADATQNQATAEEVHPMVLMARASGLGVWGRPGAVHTRYRQQSLSGASQHGAHVNDKPAEPSPSGTQKRHPSRPAATADHPTTVAAAFAVHAKVYLLAEHYGASGLQDFSLQKLKAALKTSELEVRADHATTLVKLISSVYYDLPTTTSAAAAAGTNREADTRQQLRQVVLAQAVNSLPDLQDNKGFKALLKEGGDFVEDLLSHLTKARLTLR